MTTVARSAAEPAYVARAERRVPPMGGLNPTLLRIEILRVLRNRRTMIFTLVMPAVFYLIFGVSQNYADQDAGRGNVAAYIMISMAAYGAMIASTGGGAMVATERAQAEGLENHVHFEIKDYRNIAERFDRIVSVGMFEHVGLNHYRTFFDKCAQLLKPDGVMVLHSIGRSGVPYATSAFIRKYIFPGGYIPTLSEIAEATEQVRLITTDVETPFSVGSVSTRSATIAGWARVENTIACGPSGSPTTELMSNVATRPAGIETGSGSTKSSGMPMPRTSCPTILLSAVTPFEFFFEILRKSSMKPTAPSQSTTRSVKST
jgi:SAM-dependent methyltransferase